MRIEMCGPPTSGKSSTVRSLKGRGVDWFSKKYNPRIPKEWGFFAEFINNVYKNTDYKKLPGKTLFSLAQCYQGSISKKWVVFDEALILCGFSLAIRLPEYAEEYFKIVPLPELLVVLTADHDTLKLRNEERKERNRYEKTLRCISAHEKYLPILQKRKCEIIKINTVKNTKNSVTSKIQNKMNKVSRKYNVAL